jgi:ABC-type phosphate transport system ATPase subunit
MTTEIEDRGAAVSTTGKTVEINGLNLFYGKFHAVKDVNMRVPGNRVTAFIGSSGCGKSTVLRSINRMHELVPGAYAQGRRCRSTTTSSRATSSTPSG